MKNHEQLPKQTPNINVQRHDFFATDATDEFKILRESGAEQGIFKVWAEPAIATAEHANPIEWANSLRDKPLSLFESLETWRADSARSDTVLQEIFDAQPLPEDLDDKVAELFSRLTVAFTASAPFYHLEALVADTRIDRPDNPIDFTAEASAAGKLDAVAMLLPAALQDILVAKPGAWNGLNWEKIRNTNTTDHHDILQSIAAHASIEVEDVLFIANALEFIPDQVGGKSGDFEQQHAKDTLRDVLQTQTPEPTTTTVAKDMNALIRFLNWTPAIKSDANFEGKNWKYDSVCAVAGELMQLVQEHPVELLGTDFGRTFLGLLAPQLETIDATSAKGRFLLQLKNERRFVHDANIQSTMNQRVPELLEQLDTQKQIVDFTDVSLVSQVGGKAMGLSNAQKLFGPEVVVDSRIVPVHAVNEWLTSISGCTDLLGRLEADESNHEAIASQISSLIMESMAPDELLRAFVKSISNDRQAKLAFRSSSFDEDVDIIGPAPGIYESVIDIDANDSVAVGEAFKSVVASFFSAKAIHFRDFKGLRHKPIMAVLGQQMIDGPGGSMVYEEGDRTFNIATSPSEINNLENANMVEKINLKTDEFFKDDSHIGIPLVALQQLDDLARRAQAVHGSVDIEFVFNPATERLTILQLRRLEHTTPQLSVVSNIGHTAVLSLSRMDDLEHTEGSVRLVVHASDDVDTFQGQLFKSILTKRDKIASVVIPESLPSTCHFVNILMTMGIAIETHGSHDA